MNACTDLYFIKSMHFLLHKMYTLSVAYLIFNWKICSSYFYSLTKLNGKQFTQVQLLYNISEKK